MEMNNPIRKGLPIRSYKWKKVGDSSYDGEDIIIVEGTINKADYVRLFIGFDSYSIYKIEMYKDPQIGKSLEATYIYKKNRRKIVLWYCLGVFRRRVADKASRKRRFTQRSVFSSAVSS